MKKLEVKLPKIKGMELSLRPHYLDVLVHKKTDEYYFRSFESGPNLKALLEIAKQIGKEEGINEMKKKISTFFKEMSEG
jgi:hypothetical protein